MEEKTNRLHVVIASNFAIRPHILIFSVLKIASLSPYWLWIKFSVSLFSCLFTFIINLCSHWKKVKTVTNLLLSQEDKPQTHRTVRKISRETGTHRSYLSLRTCIWNVSKGAVHRSWQSRTALLAWSALSFCFRHSRTMPLTLFCLRTKRCFQSLHLTIGRTKSVADCGNFWSRSWAFSSLRALRGLPLPDRLLTVHVSRNFLNSLLTPRSVQLF